MAAGSDDTVSVIYKILYFKKSFPSETQGLDGGEIWPGGRSHGDIIVTT